MKLSDIGEIDILKGYVLDSVDTEVGDYNNDCVSFAVDNHTLLWSIDPCPTPVAAYIGYTDPEILGWYTAIINISDIAACGGKPEALLVSIEMPEQTELEFYSKFNIGLRKALQLFNTRLLGGNLKEASQFSATGTILGKVDGKPLSRLNVLPGDKIYVIGKSGYFWAGVLQKLHNKINQKPEQQLILSNAVCYPVPNVDAGLVLKQHFDEVSCMDCSDGVLNCCYQLASLNNVYIEINKTIDWNIPDFIREIYEYHDVEIDNGCCTFGDWQLVTSIRDKYSSRLEKELNKLNIPYAHIGTVAGEGYALAREEKTVNPLHINQNFASGYNSIKSINELVSRFLYKPLFV
jgi:thiamin-phosphate kinase